MAEAGGYTNVEYRLDTGTRGLAPGSRRALLALACGAEAGFVVNNNAAAVLLVLATLARDREVLVSRGELVEIGGGFRVPEILAETGARLVEVGTTNRTRRADYERRRRNATALVLKVHASNYRMVGFTEATSVAELATSDRRSWSTPGSGLLDERTPWLAERPAWLGDEPGVRQCLEAGAALVTFSGDKLLGGPQAGIIVGRADLVALLARHPLARALRPDKVTLAGLEAVALAYLDDDGAAIPLWRMATTPRSIRLRSGGRDRDDAARGHRRRHRGGGRRRFGTRAGPSRRRGSRSRWSTSTRAAVAPRCASSRSVATARWCATCERSTRPTTNDWSPHCVPSLPVDREGRVTELAA